MSDYVRYFEKAGFEMTFKDISRIIFQLALVITLLGYIVWFAVNLSLITIQTIFFSLLLAVLVYFGMVLTVTLLVFVLADVRIATRKEAIEKVFPDYLHLVAANVRAGMPIDQALWKAVRPKFGILAKEIEIVAKQNMIGESLSVALRDFGRKYDSKVIRKSISLINEGIEAGSEMAELLENVALNIQDMHLRKESMSASVMSYVIFISFAVLIAAPILFAVANQILDVIQVIGSRINIDSSNAPGGISISLSTDAISKFDFQVFIYTALFASATMATIILSAIQSGKITDAVKKMPLYWLTAFIMYQIAQLVLGSIFSGIF